VWLVNSDKEEVDIDNAKHGFHAPPYTSSRSGLF
jgi:hypothetical protein